MNRMLPFIRCVWLAVCAGCAGSEPPAAAHAFIETFETTTEDGKPLKDRFIVSANEDLIVRCELKPARIELPEYAGRPVTPATNWEIMFVVPQPDEARTNEQPIVVAPMLQYPDPDEIKPNEIVRISGGPARELRFPHPPKQKSEDSIYGYLRMHARLPPGEYVGEFRIFPTADPRPQPGLMGNRNLGAPLTFRRTLLVVAPIQRSSN